jgi:hypothetical protein
MMRWLFLLLLPLAAEAAGLPGNWQHWQYFRSVQTPAAPAEWTSITLPSEIYGPAQGSLADLRLSDESGTEIPYLLYAQQEQCQRTWRGIPVSDTGFIPGQHSQAVIDTGSEGAPHNAVEITSDQKDFFTWTEISASDDRINWRIVREKTPFYHFDSDEQNKGEILNYPLTRSRWLRLRFLQGEKALLVTGARITHEVRIEAERIPLDVEFQIAARQAEQETLRQTDLGQMRPPVSAFRFASSQAEFHRGIRISASEDGRNWRNIAHGHIYRHTVGNDEKQRAALEISFPETHARFWRFSVINRNDPALPDLQAQMLTTPRHLAFRPGAGQNYRLLYGNPRATTAQYELAQISKDSQWKSAPVSALGKEELNRDYVSSAPWSDRHPWLLWTALIAAVSLLAWMAINALRHGHAGAKD